MSGDAACLVVQGEGGAEEVAAKQAGPGWASWYLVLMLHPLSTLLEYVTLISREVG